MLLYLKEARGFDFTGYKRTSLSRRVRRRMSQVGIEDHADYIDYLQVNADEFAALCNVLLINVTGYVRDPMNAPVCAVRNCTSTRERCRAWTNWKQIWRIGRNALSSRAGWVRSRV